MDLREWRRQLRMAVRGDPALVVDVLALGVPRECLQEAGAAVLVALATDGTVAVAERCSSALRERDEAGDARLADLIDAALAGVDPALKATPVDLEELAEALNGSPGAGPGVVDVVTGEVWPAEVVEYSADADGVDAPPEPDGDRWLALWPEGSADGYRDMRDFIATVSDAENADRLARAIENKGAFRRFRIVIDRWPEETSRWHAFSDDRQLGRARAWLAAAGYRPAARSASTNPP